jgi:uncharacterized protein (TIGR03435 family)
MRAAPGLLAAVIPMAALHGQATPTPSKYRFDVASIRPSHASDQTNRLGPTPQGGLRGENVTLVQLIALGFGVRPFLIVDAPDWASAQRFQVVATPDAPEELPPTATADQRAGFRDRIRQRLQALLTERFGLVIRTEKRPMPVYKLVVAKGGHKMTQTTSQEPRRMESNSQMLRGSGVDMNTVADSLTGILLRSVINETDLTGTFNFDMKFADVRLQATPDAKPGDVSDAPTIFTAITERLGLRLEPDRAEVAVFVVERVHRPSEN